MLFFLLTMLVVIVDQLTKYYVVTHFYLGESVPVIENVFHWTYILNPGAAFGMLEGSRWFFILIALVVVAGVYYLRREIMENGPFMKYGTALFVGGAIGNLIDRARSGLVIDFLILEFGPFLT